MTAEAAAGTNPTKEVRSRPGGFKSGAGTRARTWCFTWAPAPLAVICVLWFASCGTRLEPLTGPVPADDGLGAWRTLLARHVDADGGVDYAGLARDEALLEEAYRGIAARSPASHPAAFPTREAQLAYWIDAYNIATLLTVRRLRVDASVMDVGAPFPLGLVSPAGAGFFYFTCQVYGGRSLSLYALEHDVIRAVFGEPRIHFAINCASRSCPPLEATPFRGAALEARLRAATERFVADDRHVHVDLEAGRVRLSAIFDWFAEDFPDRFGFLIDHARGPKRVALERATRERFAVTFAPYDWRLNRRTSKNESKR